MEVLKKDLRQVPENERVKGRVYGVADELVGKLDICAIYKQSDISNREERWNYWLELPESMLPVREVMPEVGREYEMSGFGMPPRIQTLKSFTSTDGLVWTHIRPIPTNPAKTLNIPSGTKAEQLEYLRGVIATLEGGGV